MSIMNRADFAQDALMGNYWNETTSIMNQWYPREANRADENYYYWWQAHVIDVFVDGLNRTGDRLYKDRIEAIYEGLLRSNGGTFLHHYYDDMEWLGLALLRAYQATGNEAYKQSALELWADIKTAWSDHMGGGMAWNKGQLDYKNTPANAPAAILAARLFQCFGDKSDLEWALKIYKWNKENLVDPETGFVWDGINRLGDMQIDYDWAFTYCQGVYIGAGVELYRSTGDRSFLDEAKRTAHACIVRLCSPGNLVLPDEGIDDTGLFKGILVRYLVELLRAAPEMNEVREVVLANRAILLEQGLDKASGLCGPSWEGLPVVPVQLSVQLSGVMLLEAAEALQRLE
ncbi:glycoside hydrolase family 76 protein [Bacillus sp. FJAT-26390]|uniref:glycoside hydrolase family 76 protein n=1 Tax=Bacillus sp. FJAT-26390 TaxID=1743142 RepID=UPI000A71C13B|nr:glycoside hydrolase family 76 protein [Bacillus sp. FJAT-26390]